MYMYERTVYKPTLFTKRGLID